MTEEFAPAEAAIGQPGWSRHWLAYFAVLLVVVGSLLLAIGSLMPAYSDSVAAERVRSGSECEPGVPNTDKNLQCPNELWHRSVNSLRTGKWSLVDRGGGLLASGLTLCAFSWWRRKKSLRQLLTPKRTLSILVLAAVSWLAQIPAYSLFFLTELTRGYYPHWADSIGIPIFQFEAVLLGLFLPYMTIWLLFVVGARLPASVFSNVPGRPLVNVFWNSATAVLLVPTMLVLFGAVLEGPIMMVPLLWLTVWLALCARAAALTRHRPGAVH